MEGRELRGLEIAARFRINRQGEAWKVPSQSTNSRRYTVSMNGAGPECTCPDYEARNLRCKHIFAVQYVIEREENADGTTTVTETLQVTEQVRRTYPQNWPAYNAAQTNEKLHFQVLLRDLCSGIEEPPRQKCGRPPISKRDAIFSATFKVFSTVSGRRCISDLHDACEKGFISRVPHFNSIFNVFDSEDTSDILHSLIEQSSLPLRSLESHFAADSSGFSSSRFDRWHVKKHGKGRKERWRAWVKAHVMTGTLTNVVTAVEILGPYAHDGNRLPGLVERTAANFDMTEVSADSAYSSERNLRVIQDAGAVPYIPFKRNARPDLKGGLWAKMFGYYQYQREEFLQHYHRRSNVESTFNMVKAKFGDAVRSKTDTAMKNEVLCKLLCHNICCVIQSMYEFRIEPLFLNTSLRG